MNALGELEKWYASQCNGVWEHQKGVKIDTLDNPGWRLQVDLQGTALEGKPFPEHRYGVGKDAEPQGQDWVDCRVEQNVFKADGGPLKLAEMIEVFLEWARRNS